MGNCLLQCLSRGKGDNTSGPGEGLLVQSYGRPSGMSGVLEVGGAGELLARMEMEQNLWKPGQLGGWCRGRYP